MGNECTEAIVDDIANRSMHKEKASRFRAETVLGGEEEVGQLGKVGKVQRRRRQIGVTQVSVGLIREVRREKVRNRSGPKKKLRRKHLSWLK